MTTLKFVAAQSGMHWVLQLIQALLHDNKHATFAYRVSAPCT